MSASTVTGASQSATQALLSQLSSQSGSGVSSATAATDPSAKLNQQFLTLLVAQMNNQDPLNPLDNTQLTSQLAQISTVSGINGVNTSVTQLVKQFQQLETMQAAQLSGKDVLVKGGTMTLGSSASGSGSSSSSSSSSSAASQSGRFAVDIASGADTVTAKIVDASGKTVRTLKLGAQPTGLQQFTWDGKDDSGTALAGGTYTVSVSATNGGNAVGTTLYAAQQVTGTTTDATGALQLQLAGGGTVAFGDVKQFL